MRKEKICTGAAFLSVLFWIWNLILQSGSHRNLLVESLIQYIISPLKNTDEV